MIQSLEAGLVVFARIPERGRVKTRLRSHFSEEQTLAIYEAMLRDVLALAQDLSGQIANISIYWTGGAGDELPARFLREFHSFHHHRQRGEHLGLRMYHAMEDEFLRGRKKVVLIGCDSPTLPIAFVLQALDLLEASDLVLGPAEDGGYYLVAASHLIPYPFEGVTWGTSEVLPQTQALASKHQVKLSLLPMWYDLDRPEDLARLYEQSTESGAAKNLRALLSRLSIDD